MVGEEGTRLTVAGGPGSLLLWTGGGMEWVIPWVVERRRVPAHLPQEARANPQQDPFPGAKGTTSAVQAGRGASRGHRGRERVLSPSPAADRAEGAAVRALGLEPCPETFHCEAMAVAAGIRSCCRGSPGQARGRVRVGEWGSTGRRSRRP